MPGVLQSCFKCCQTRKIFTWNVSLWMCVPVVTIKDWSLLLWISRIETIFWIGMTSVKSRLLSLYYNKISLWLFNYLIRYCSWQCMSYDTGAVYGRYRGCLIAMYEMWLCTGAVYERYRECVIPMYEMWLCTGAVYGRYRGCVIPMYEMWLCTGFFREKMVHLNRW